VTLMPARAECPRNNMPSAIAIPPVGSGGSLPERRGGHRLDFLLHMRLFSHVKINIAELSKER